MRPSVELNLYTIALMSDHRKQFQLTVCGNDQKIKKSVGSTLQLFKFDAFISPFKAAPMLSDMYTCTRSKKMSEEIAEPQ